MDGMEMTVKCAQNLSHECACDHQGLVKLCVQAQCMFWCATRSSKCSVSTSSLVFTLLCIVSCLLLDASFQFSLLWYCNFHFYFHVILGVVFTQCRLDMFQGSDFAGHVEDSKSTSSGTLCVFGSHTFVPISWMCNPARNTNRSHQERRDPCINKFEVRSTPTIQKRTQSHGIIDYLDNVDFISWNVHASHLLCLFIFSHFQFYSALWHKGEKNAKKILVTKESQQNRSQWWI